MALKSVRTRALGPWWLLACAVAGCVTAVVALVDEGNGIAYSGGAYLVFVTTMLLVAASLIIALDHHRRKWLTVTLAILILMDLVGTAFAAYFLEASVLVVFMALGLAGWLVYVLTGSAQDDSFPHTAARSVR